MIHYIKNNILSMIKHEKWFSFILILTQCISVMVAFFASGMIYNFTIKEKAMEGTMLMISFEKDSEILGDISAEEIKKTYKDIYKLLNRKIDYADYCFSYTGKYGEEPPLSEDLQAEMWELAGKFLDSHGMPRYEISNHALPDGECRHNQNIWHGESYLGLGPSACSFDGANRFTNAAPLSEWLKGAAAYFRIFALEMISTVR